MNMRQVMFIRIKKIHHYDNTINIEITGMLNFR